MRSRLVPALLVGSMLLAGSMLLTACTAGTPTATAPAPAAGTPAASVLVVEKEVTLATGGEAVLALRAGAPGTAWARQGAEAATVSVHVDGAYKADVVLFRGETVFTYEALLGELAAGKHQVAVRLEPAKSAAAAKEVKVEDAAVRVYPPGDPLYEVMAYAPILYGRDESRYSDTPLFTYYEVVQYGVSRTIQYTWIFSNEDGGTAADALMSRWGRLTDIEWVYRVTLAQGASSAAGAVLKEEFQDKDHNTAAFKGSKDGRHPLLKNVTRNNLFADVGTSAYRFALVPAETLTAGSREEMMDLHPWTYRVMAEEWQREAQDGTEKTASPDTRQVSDPRNYLYVEFNSGPLPGQACDGKLAFQAKLRDGERWYSSDHAVDSLRIQGAVGWRRGTIELPPGTTAGQVEGLRFVIYPGKATACALAVTGVRKVFLLGQDYVPGPSLWAWSGQQALDADPASATPDTFTLPSR